MARWLRLDDKIINLDAVTMVEPAQIRVQGDGPVWGTRFYIAFTELRVVTRLPVEEVFRLIECAEGPEPPRARE